MPPLADPDGLLRHGLAVLVDERDRCIDEPMGYGVDEQVALLLRGVSIICVPSLGSSVSKPEPAADEFLG